MMVRLIFFEPGDRTIMKRSLFSYLPSQSEMVIFYCWIVLQQARIFLNINIHQSKSKYDRSTKKNNTRESHKSKIY